ncbi:hypothetical protein F511_44934 [Dorcoceras hygrometricum]|uniref:Uncharacterized protein n=1 Tax=Dorcoceras hygrometricum TaxID=472368 RepID=A0A2Z7AAZ1_9LAMI|nr:hypothetical protein F511_44934 [Dorcoceras hygrometricum]
MQIDSDLVIYRTTLVRTFQVVTICRVDKSEVLVVLISPHDSKLTLVMSLFDLQDVCIAIGSIATLDLPMVVDLIGIYGLKGPYSVAAAAVASLVGIVSGQLDEENPSVQISSGLLVQSDKGIPSPVVDLIDDIYRRLP